MDDHIATEQRSPSGRFRHVAQRATAATGSGAAAATVAASFILWCGVGLGVGFPRWWELSVTVGLPFLTLFMLVVIQYTQNHDDRATRLKLDELIRATQGATNRMMAVEDASPQDLDKISDEFRNQAESADHRE